MDSGSLDILVKEESTEEEDYGWEDESVRNIMRNIVSGDRKALDNLMSIYFIRIIFFARKIVGNYEDARDVSQDVFEKIWKSPEKYNPNQKFFTWLYKLTINASIDYLRRWGTKRGREIISLSDKTLEELSDDNGYNPCELLIRKEMREILVEARDKVCNPKEKEILFLYYYKDLSYDQVGEILGMGKNVPNNHSFKARKKIRKYFQSRGY